MNLDRTIPPAVSLLDDFHIEKPELRVMKNGMPLNVIQAGDEDVVRFDIIIRGGQLSQTQPLQASLTNRLLREGSRRYTSSEIAERLDYYGAWLDLASSVNYGYVTLYSLNKYFDQTMDVLASIIKEPTFEEDKLEIAVDVSRQNFLVNEERVDILAHKRMIQSLFGAEHSLGRFAVKSDFDRINRDVIQQLYDRTYNSSNATTYVSGKVTPEIVRCIERHFGDERWGKTSQPIRLDISKPMVEEGKRFVVEKENVMQSAIKMGCFTLPNRHEDYLKLKVLVTLFGGYFGSRLMSNIREEKGYTYGISSGVISYPEFSVLAIGTEADNSYIAPIIKEVYNEIDRLQNENVTMQELEMVRNYMLGDICRSYEGAFSLSDAWIFIKSTGHSDDYFEQTIQTVRNITVEDMRSMAQKHLSKEALKEVIAGKL